MSDTVLITLMRHAKSDWDHPQLADFDRPLNERGLADIPAMARRFGAPPTRVVSSPAKRAITTAHGLARHLGLPARAVLTDETLYAASPAAIWQALCAAAVSPGADAHVLVVGHNPGMSDLARVLIPVELAELPTCSWVRWEVHAGALAGDAPPAECAKLIEFSTPKGKLDRRG